MTDTFVKSCSEMFNYSGICESNSVVVQNDIQSQCSSVFAPTEWTMNGLSVSELCCLFCCPPFPSRIAAKLAFLPPEPTYSLLPDLEGSAATGTAGTAGLRSRASGVPGAAVGGSVSTGPAEGKWKLHLTERAEFQYSQRELDATDVFLTRSSRGNRVGCMYIRCAPTARLVTRVCVCTHLGSLRLYCFTMCHTSSDKLTPCSSCGVFAMPLFCLCAISLLPVLASSLCQAISNLFSSCFPHSLFMPSSLTYRYHSPCFYPNSCSHFLPVVL